MIPYGFGKAGVTIKDGIPRRDSWGKQQSRKGFLVGKFVEFCKRTDLHGYKYIVMDDLSNVER